MKGYDSHHVVGCSVDHFAAQELPFRGILSRQYEYPLNSPGQLKADP